MTLAPECDAGGHVTEFLVNGGVTVSAGHCNPTLDQLRAGISHGLSMFTHVGNACPLLMHRHDNIIQRVLSLSDQLWLCFIPDGVHIDFFALKNYLRCAGVERSIFVTDAISAARLGPGRYTLAGWDILIGEDLVARSPDGSHFVGSTVTVPRIKANALHDLGMTEAELTRVLDENPRKAMAA
jgi:N-acetylglucosamine-6-phosphate deacetylase